MSAAHRTDTDHGAYACPDGESEKTLTADYLTCEELVELVTEYFEDALSPRDRARFEEHIMTCPPCQVHLDQMRRTIDVVGHIPAEQLSPAAEQDLLEAFRDWKSA